MSEQNACPKCGTNFWMNVAPNGAALYRCGYVVGGLQTDGCRIRELEKEVDKLLVFVAQVARNEDCYCISSPCVHEQARTILSSKELTK